jgi:hypothetical protein
MKKSKTEVITKTTQITLTFDETEAEILRALANYVNSFADGIANVKEYAENWSDCHTGYKALTNLSVEDFKKVIGALSDLPGVDN